MKRKGHRKVQCIFNINKRDFLRQDMQLKNKITINLLEAWNVVTRFFPRCIFDALFNVLPSQYFFEYKKFVYWQSSQGARLKQHKRQQCDKSNEYIKLGWLFMNLQCSCKFHLKKRPKFVLIFFYYFGHAQFVIGFMIFFLLVFWENVKCFWWKKLKKKKSVAFSWLQIYKISWDLQTTS